MQGVLSPSPSPSPSDTPIIPSPATQSVLNDGGIFSVLEINLVIGILSFLVLSYLRWRSQRKLYFKYYGVEYQQFWENERFSGNDSLSSFPAIDEQEGAEVESLLEGGADNSNDTNQSDSTSRSLNQVKMRELNELSKNGPEPFMGWVLPLVRMSKVEIAEKCGNDALIYIHFQRCMISFLAICSVLGLAIVLPVNITATQNDDKINSGFLSTTIGNIDDTKEKGRYWAHSIVCVAISLLVYGLVWYLRRYLIASKDKFLVRSVKSAVSAHTIMIRNFPASIVDEEAIKTHFQEMIEKNSSLKMDVQRVKEKRRRRRTLSLEGQAQAAAALELLRSADSLSARNTSSDIDVDVHIHEEKGKEKDSDNDDAPDHAGDQDSHNHQFAEESWERQESKHQSTTNQGMEYLTKQKEHGSREGDNEAGEQHARKPTVIAVHVAWEVRDVLGALETYQDIYEQLNHYRHEKIMRGRRPLVWFPPSSSLGEKLVYLAYHFRTIAEGIIYGDGRGQLDAIRELKRKKGEQGKEVERAKERAKAARGTGVVFVTFSSSVIAKVIVSAYQSYARFWKLSYWLGEDLTSYSRALRDKQWIVNMAPEPEDIIWPNLGIGKWERRLRLFHVNLTLLLFFSFFTTPLSVISALQPLKYAPLFADLINGLHEWNNKAILFAYLPTLLLLAVTTILPLVIWFSSIFEGHHAKSSTHKHLVVKIYAFLLFSVLLLPSLFLTSLDALIRKGWDNRQHLNILFSGLFLPSSAAFFINYIIQMSIVGQIVEVMRLPERLQSVLLRWKAVTISQKKRADEYAYPHEYGMQYAYMMVFFATILTFSTIAPLILPFGLIYFISKHFLDTYLLVHIRPREFDSDGSMLWIVLRVMLFTVVLFQFLMFIFLTLHGTIAQMAFVGSTLALALLAFFVAYMARMDIFRFHKVSKLNVLPKEDDWMSVFHTAYEHPCWRSTLSEQLQQQQQYPHLAAASITYINPARGRSLTK